MRTYEGGGGERTAEQTKSTGEGRVGEWSVPASQASARSCVGTTFTKQQRGFRNEAKRHRRTNGTFNASIAACPASKYPNVRSIQRCRRADTCSDSNMVRWYFTNAAASSHHDGSSEPQPSQRYGGRWAMNPALARVTHPCQATLGGET